MPRIAKAAVEVLDMPQQQLMDMFGYAFVTFVGESVKASWPVQQIQN